MVAAALARDPKLNNNTAINRDLPLVIILLFSFVLVLILIYSYLCIICEWRMERMEDRES